MSAVLLAVEVVPGNPLNPCLSLYVLESESSNWWDVGLEDQDDAVIAADGLRWPVDNILILRYLLVGLPDRYNNEPV